MRRERISALAVLIVVLLLTGCSGSTSSLLGDSSSTHGGQVSSLPVRFSNDLRGLPISSLAHWKP